MMLSPPQSIVCLNKLADGSIDSLEMRCASEVSRTEPCTFSQLLSAIQRGRYRCLCVCTGSGTPASCLGVACGASERMCLQRNYRSVEWPTLSGRAKLRGELPRFFISAVRFSFLESCLELSLNKYAKFPCVNCMLGSNFKGSERFGEIF